MKKKIDIIFSLKSRIDYKQTLLQLIREGKGNPNWDYGNIEREIWGMQHALYLIESGNYDDEFR